MRRIAVVAAVSVVLSISGCRLFSKDYLSADQRARVDELKASVAQQPTTAANLPQRLPAMWDWANAYALSGGALPVQLPIAVAYLGISVTDGTDPDPAMLADFDAYVRELTLKDEQPDAIGRLELSTTGPLVAGSWQTIEQTYTVGSRPLATGGVVLLGRQLVADQGGYQTDDPAGDNHVSIRSSNPRAAFTATTVPLRGMHGGFRGAQDMPAFRLDGPALERGDTVTVTYGDRSGGSSGFRIQTDSTDRLLLPLYLDLDGSGAFLTPTWPGLEVVGTEPRSVRAIGPSIVAPGEPFDLAVRIEDRYSNRASGAMPALRVLLNGQPYTEIAAGGESLVVLSGITHDRPEVCRFQLSSDDGAVGGESNPIWVRDAPGNRVWWGETHGHTDFAEGQGSPEHYFRYARDDARLDFFSLSEHDLMMDASEWRHLQELAREYASQGDTIPFLGYEWTVTRTRGGHHNVLFRTPDREIVGIHRANLLPELYRLLAAENAADDVIVIPHAHNAGDWTQSDPELERLVEIYSQHGTFEWFGNFYLQNGFEVGFLAASDDHRAKPGYARGRPLAPLAQLGGLAAVLAPSKTPDAIFDAMRNLSAYATSGQRIILDARLNGAPMGSRQPDSPQRQITCRVMGTAPIDTIDVIKNGDVVYSTSYSTSAIGEPTWVLIGFSSSSEVFGEVRDNPRPYRIWQGTLEVTGARVANVDAPGFDNAFTDRIEWNPEQRDTIRFRTETRGRRDTLKLELEGASPATAFRFRLEPTTEYGYAPPLVRPPAELPGDDFRLRLSEVVQGRVERRFQVDRHTDRIELQVIRPAAMMDQGFEYTDLGPNAPGDYYYVRVTQIDGARAWSSPFWVGQR